MKDIPILTKYKHQLSWFEKARVNVNLKIFYFFHMLLKYQDSNISLEVIMITIEMIQLLAFAFSLQVTYSHIIDMLSLSHHGKGVLNSGKSVISCIPFNYCTSYRIMKTFI